MGVPSQKPERRIAPLTFFMLLAPYAALAADPSRGAELYERKCTGCHSLDANRVGPAHRGVVGRKAGTAAGFKFSPSYGASGATWNVGSTRVGTCTPPSSSPGTWQPTRSTAAHSPPPPRGYAPTSSSSTRR